MREVKKGDIIEARAWNEVVKNVNVLNGTQGTSKNSGSVLGAFSLGRPVRQFDLINGKDSESGGIWARFSGGDLIIKQTLQTPASSNQDDAGSLYKNIVVSVAPMVDEMQFQEGDFLAVRVTWQDFNQTPTALLVQIKKDDIAEELNNDCVILGKFTKSKTNGEAATDLLHYQAFTHSPILTVTPPAWHNAEIQRMGLIQGISQGGDSLGIINGIINIPNYPEPQPTIDKVVTGDDTRTSFILGDTLTLSTCLFQAEPITPGIIRGVTMAAVGTGPHIEDGIIYIPWTETVTMGEIEAAIQEALAELQWELTATGLLENTFQGTLNVSSLGNGDSQGGNVETVVSY